MRGLKNLTARVGEGVTALAVIVAACLSASAAAEVVEWAEPGGRYTLSYDNEEWRLNEGAPGEGEVLALQHREDVGEEALVRCVVRQAPFPTVPGAAQLDQAKVNSFIGQAYSEDAARGFFRDAVVGVVTQQQIEGVTVSNLNVEAITEGPHFSMRYRIFGVMDADGARYHELRCAGSIPVSAPAQQSTDAFLDSLQFTLEPQ